MRVMVAKSAGFCWGVKRAVELARRLASERGAPVHTDGPLIHNRPMMTQLRSENVVETSDPASIRTGILMIRAHGIPPARRAMLDRLPVEKADATCPDVAKIQNMIRDHVHRGFHIVIFGDPGHAEVEGLLGYAEGKGRVISGPDQVAPLPELSPVCLVSQSTQMPDAYAEIARRFRERFPGSVVLDTICRSTRNRQAELVELAKTVDAIVVVGDPHSANTRRLVELAQSFRPTFHIQTHDQLDAAALRGYASVGLTAGASTPAFVIDAVKAALEKL